EKALKHAKEKGSLSYMQTEHPERDATSMLLDDEIILWFQGRMEYGPRALGNRSILAMPDNPENRNKINSIIKRRPYYQPFASTILQEDAPRLLEDYLYANKFMTSANRIFPEHYPELVAASHIDRTTRPQILGNENPLYRKLIEEVKRKNGIGAVLNTSLNKHGMPIVMDPEDAIWTLENTGAEVLIIGNYIARKSSKAKA
ncbi:MAG: carbamoyltransferase C-terminal domain-containing protein, partial [Candidatus Micrarchaeaceae archaeon]